MDTNSISSTTPTDPTARSLSPSGGPSNTLDQSSSDNDHNDDDEDDDDYDEEFDEDDDNVQVDLPMLVNELQRISDSVNKVFGAIQHSMEYSARASLLISEFTVSQVEELSVESQNLHTQVSYIFDLFTTLQMKMSQLTTVTTLLPAYEKELDAIIAQLPYLERRVQKVVQGLMDGTHVFTPPSAEDQALFAQRIEDKYEQEMLASKQGVKK